MGGALGWDCCFGKLNSRSSVPFPIVFGTLYFNPCARETPSPLKFISRLFLTCYLFGFSDLVSMQNQPMNG